eukprot:3308399-Prorocentrum_lima.AAC.1
MRQTGQVSSPFLLDSRTILVSAEAFGSADSGRSTPGLLAGAFGPASTPGKGSILTEYPIDESGSGKPGVQAVDPYDCYN